MRVISFVTQKGGSGKTTLAFCCAVAAQEKGRRALLLDMDPQGTATTWFKDRESDTPTLASIKSSELIDAIKRAEKAGYDLIFIDTPGRDEPATAAAIRVADLCIIPCRPTPGDMKALAVIGRAAGVADFGRLRFHGLIAWLLWLFVHLMYLVQFRNRVIVFIRWGFQYLSFDRGARLITGSLADRNP